MKVGVLPFSLGATYPDLEASWRTAEDAGFAALWTIDHMTPTAELKHAWEASALLVAMAARTTTIPVGVLVFDVMLRNPGILAGSVAVAQALAGDRVRVGLGVGDRFSKIDHDALGIEFPPLSERVRILEATCAALRDAGEVIVGGGSRLLMETAVRQADGWNLFTQRADVFAARVKELETVEAAHGRRPLSRSVYLFVDRIEGDLVQTLEDLEAAGAGEAMLVVMHPTASAIDALARRVLDTRPRRESRPTH